MLVYSWVHLGLINVVMTLPWIQLSLKRKSSHKIKGTRIITSDQCIILEYLRFHFPVYLPIHIERRHENWKTRLATGDYALHTLT